MARQAARSIGVLPDLGISVPCGDGLLGEVLSNNAKQESFQVSWPQSGEVSFLDEQKAVPLQVPKVAQKPKP